MTTGNRLTRTCAAVLLLGLFVFAACNRERGRLDVQVSAQQQKVTTCDSSLAKETRRLKEMQDSLEVRIARNVAIGMPESQARAVETTLLKAQQAVVEAEAVNLKTQQEYLTLLKKRMGTLQGE